MGQKKKWFFCFDEDLVGARSREFQLEKEGESPSALWLSRWKTHV